MSTEREAGLATESVSVVLRKEKPLGPAGIRIPARPARSVVTIPITPSRFLSSLKLLTKAELTEDKINVSFFYGTVMCRGSVLSESH